MSSSWLCRLLGLAKNTFAIMKYDVTNTNAKNTPHHITSRGGEEAGYLYMSTDQKLVALGYNFDISQSQLATRLCEEKEIPALAGTILPYLHNC